MVFQGRSLIIILEYVSTPAAVIHQIPHRLLNFKLSCLYICNSPLDFPFSIASRYVTRQGSYRRLAQEARTTLSTNHFLFNTNTNNPNHHNFLNSVDRNSSFTSCQLYVPSGNPKHYVYLPFTTPTDSQTLLRVTRSAALPQPPMFQVVFL